MAGAGLTSLGDMRLARLDANVSNAVTAGDAAATSASTAAANASAAQAAAANVASMLPTADYLTGTSNADGSIDIAIAGDVSVSSLSHGAIAQLAGAKIEVTAPTLTAAGMTRAIVRRRAYTGGNRLTFAISGYQGRSLATATAIRLHALANQAGATEAWSLDHDELVVVDSDVGDYLLYFAATATQTAAAEASEYRFGIDAVFASFDPEVVLDPLHRLRVLSPATVGRRCWSPGNHPPSLVAERPPHVPQLPPPLGSPRRGGPGFAGGGSRSATPLTGRTSGRLPFRTKPRIPRGFSDGPSTRPRTPQIR